MATLMEAPIAGSEAGVTGEIQLLPDGPPSGIDPWFELDAGVWSGPAEIRPPSVFLEDGDATRRICDVIAAWRAADRELAGLVEGDPGWARVHDELVGLRALHHRLFAAHVGESPTGEEPAARWAFAIMAWGPAPLPSRVMA